ncbi:MAG: hypothetical protein MK052_07285 [Alphaproteobacteria bacterium]|nr:hypothetical protein [Alphaproteobacteria bacterium]
MYKTILTIALSSCLAACNTTSTTEAIVLKEGAIADVRKADKEIHLGFLKCYALPSNDKDNCQRIVGKNHARYEGASSWDYIRPFRYEAERMGFKAFLNDQGKLCNAVNEGPRYDENIKAFQVQCSSGEHYAMQFDRKEMQWKLVE